MVGGSKGVRLMINDGVLGSKSLPLRAMGFPESCRSIKTPKPLNPKPLNLSLPASHHPVSATTKPSKPKSCLGLGLCGKQGAEGLERLIGLPCLVLI